MPCSPVILSSTCNPVIRRPAVKARHASTSNPVWLKRPPFPNFRTRRSCSPSIERNRTMARTRRSRRSYGAGEWGRNRVRIFPDPKTGLFQIEWRENGRRLSRSLKHRDWRRAKRQADQFAAGFIDAPNGKAEAKPEPLTLEKRTVSGVNHGRESSNYLQGRTICAFCPLTASTPVVQKQRRSPLKSRESPSPSRHPPPTVLKTMAQAGRAASDATLPNLEGSSDVPHGPARHDARSREIRAKPIGGRTHDPHDRTRLERDRELHLGHQIKDDDLPEKPTLRGGQPMSQSGQAAVKLP